MALPVWLGEVLRPIADVIDELHTSAEEKGQVRAALLKVQIDLVSKVLEYEAEIAKAQRDVIVAEASGESWMQRSWRPLLMLTFTAIIAWQYLIYPIISAIFPKLPTVTLPSEMWTLLTVGVGGYIVSRSGEKIAQTLRSARDYESNRD
jgi:hypothetical protein